MLRNAFGWMKIVLAGAVLAAGASAQPAVETAAPLPNIVLIITDDLGWGDLGCYGATQIPTPNIDRLAAQGRRFTQAYAPSATCTPSRYALMTGQYGWRQPPRKTGILNGDAPLCIDPGSQTLPTLLKQAGYTTGLVGKWHLGLGDGQTPIDFNRPIAPGPLEIGFDSAFFIPATVDRVPCVFIKDHQVANLDLADPITVNYTEPLAGAPAGRDHPELLKVQADNQHADVIVNGISRIGFMTGGMAARWTDEDIAATLVEHSIDFLEQNQDRPFFLCLGTHDPHVPRAPAPRFRGQSGCGIRGDAIVQIDWLAGEVFAALDRLDLTENTLVVFTSDNGPVLFDGYFDGALEDVGDHRPAGGLRGWKYLVYEGGTRVPLIARWPGRVRPGVSDQCVSLVDMLATFGALTGQPLAAGAGMDSLDLSGVLLGQAGESPRQDIVQHGIGGGLALRRGTWKYIPANASAAMNDIGKGADPRDQRFADSRIVEPLLFDLAADPAETRNVIAEHPEIARQLADRLQRIRDLQPAVPAQ